MLVFGDPQPYNEREVHYFYEGLVKEVENEILLLYLYHYIIIQLI
jgi:hypothetical protein